MPQLERPKLQRKVTFRNDETDSPEKVCASPLSETLTVETNRELWYQRDEINAFRKEVGTILLYGRKLATVDEDVFCGLERHDLQRSNAKKNAIRLVLKAQKLERGPDFLRKVSREVSKRARDMALVQGLGDYCRVYYRKGIHACADSFESIRTSSYEMSNTSCCKRTIASDESRRVRRRVF